MKLTIPKLACLFSIAILSQPSFATDDTAIYKNERGSILKLQIHSDHTLSGTFTTAVATKECQKAIGIERPIIGYIVQNAITISVSYPDCHSVLTFIGNVGKNNQLIDTTAILARQATDVMKEGPGARMISHDVFKRA